MYDKYQFKNNSPVSCTNIKPSCAVLKPYFSTFKKHHYIVIYSYNIYTRHRDWTRKANCAAISWPFFFSLCYFSCRWLRSARKTCVMHSQKGRALTIRFIIIFDITVYKQLICSGCGPFSTKWIKIIYVAFHLSCNCFFVLAEKSLCVIWYSNSDRSVFISCNYTRTFFFISGCSDSAHFKSPLFWPFWHASLFKIVPIKHKIDMIFKCLIIFVMLGVHNILMFILRKLRLK